MFKNLPSGAWWVLRNTDAGMAGYEIYRHGHPAVWEWGRTRETLFRAMYG